LARAPWGEESETVIDEISPFFLSIEYFKPQFSVIYPACLESWEPRLKMLHQYALDPSILFGAGIVLSQAFVSLLSLGGVVIA